MPVSPESACARRSRQPHPSRPPARGCRPISSPRPHRRFRSAIPLRFMRPSPALRPRPGGPLQRSSGRRCHQHPLRVTASGSRFRPVAAADRGGDPLEMVRGRRLLRGVRHPRRAAARPAARFHRGQGPHTARDLRGRLHTARARRPRPGGAVLHADGRCCLGGRQRGRQARPLLPRGNQLAKLFITTASEAS